MRLAVLSFIIFTYVVVSLIISMPCRPMLKGTTGIIFLAISLKYVIYEKISGYFIAPDLPRSLLLLLETMYASMVILFFLLLIKDVSILFLWLSRCIGTSWRLPFSPIVRSTGLISVALILGIFGTWQSIRIPDVRTLEISLPKIPASLDGFSIVQLSDIHIGPLLKGDWLLKVVEKTNSLSPDLVALTGDMIDGSPDKLKEDIAPLAKLHSKYGIYGITGNHEYYFQVKKWLPVFEKLGIIMLHNEHKTISIDSGAKIVIAGMPDQTEQRFKGPGPDINKTLENAPNNVVRVLLAHRPHEASGNIKADIQLSGHTHGGLIFFLKWLMANFNGGLVEGLYDVDGMKLYVSPGTGIWSGFSYRLGVPSEITCIVLRSQKKIDYH